MKLFLFVFLFFVMAAAQSEGQNDIIELKNGTKVETKIISHTDTLVTTTVGKYSFKKIRKISFFVKNYDDVDFYKKLEASGIEVQFITRPH